MWERGITNLTPWKDIYAQSTQPNLALFIVLVICAIFVLIKENKK